MTQHAHYAVIAYIVCELGQHCCLAHTLETQSTYNSLIGLYVSLMSASTEKHFVQSSVCITFGRLLVHSLKQFACYAIITVLVHKISLH